MRADKGPTATSTEEWQDAVGLCSPSSGTEVIYGQQEWYDEDAAQQYLSPATKKREHYTFEKELAEITTDSDMAAEYYPTEKTTEQMDAIIAKYH